MTQQSVPKERQAPSPPHRILANLVHPQSDRRKFWSCCVLATSIVLCLYAHPTPVPSAPDSVESKFLGANNKAMAKMMNGMKIKESGDVDRDFTNLMIPHHQGAIDMARAELQYGKNEQLRRIAQEIIVGQQQEIVAMRLAMGDPLPPSVPVPTQPKRGNAWSSPAAPVLSSN
jgi:hypothetical protein